MIASLALSGCATTATTTGAAGEPITVKAGFGNRVTVVPITVEPSPVIVAAGERLAAVAGNAALAEIADRVERSAER